MPLKLLSPGGGSVLLQANTTSLDYTLTVPAETANLITTASSTGINASAMSLGTIPRTRMPSTSILQTTQGTYASTVAFTNVTNGTEYNTQLSGTITPSSSTSKILIFVNLQVWMQNGSGSTWYGHPRIYRNSTIVYSGADAQIVWGTNVEVGGLWTLIHLDSPATTSSITYSVRWVHDGALTMSNLMFHRGNNPDSITLLEVAA